MTDILEKGQVFYFYRPTVEAEEPSDVQRLYLVMKTDCRYRVLLIGANELPRTGDGPHPARRRWAWVRLVTEDRSELEALLAGGQYETKTEGTRHLPPAAPVGEGSYALVTHEDHTELVHELARSKEGPLEDELGLTQQARFILAVKNPEVKVKGFPDADPGYPKKLAEAFANRRWISVQDPRFLDYPDTQLLLIGADDEDAAEELGIDLSAEGDVFCELDLDLPKAGITESEFPSLEAFERRHHESKDVGFASGSSSKGGSSKGGREASRRSASSTAVTKLLGGIDLPARASEIRDYASSHRDRLDDPEPALERIADLPTGRYETMADVTRALSSVEPHTFECPACGRTFDERSRYLHHWRTSHPEQAPSAADVESALAGVRFPAEKADLEAHVKDAGTPVRELMAELPSREYRDAADVAVAVHDFITEEDTERDEASSRRGGRRGGAEAR